MKEKKILIIDDDPIILFLHEVILKEIAPQAQIIPLESGVLAKDYLIEHQNEEFLLFLDINMPLMNGWELLDFISRTDCQLGVLVLMVTSSVNDSDRVKAFQYPMVKGMLIKPLNLEHIINTIEGQTIKKFLDV